MRKSLILLFVLSGCLHTREVEKESKPDEDTEGVVKKEDGEVVAEKPAVPATGPTGKPVPKPTSPTARPPVEEGRPELAVSPSGLMKPDGARLIQQALVKRGYLPKTHETNELDKETSGALRKFQGDQDLARTGSPDRETVRKLGISVDDVFRSVKDNV